MVATKRARRIFVLVLTLALTLAMYALVHADSSTADAAPAEAPAASEGASNTIDTTNKDGAITDDPQNGTAGNTVTTGSATDVTTGGATEVTTGGATEVTTGSTIHHSSGSGSSTRKQFVDVPKASYYYDAVYWALDKNITEGTDATHFSPMSGVKRADFVLFLYRHAGSPKVSGTMPFTDVPANAYYHDAVLWAYQKGITEGTSETTFSPLKTVTRAQAVTFLYRMAGEPEITAENSFSDVDEDAYYFEAVLWAIKNGITDGTSKTTFSPDNTCNRAQAITFIYRDLK